MAKLKEKYEAVHKALLTFSEILDQNYSPIIRDAAIQRFEYTFEICWKTLQAYLNEHEGVIANSPKSAFREALSIGVFEADEVELALEMTDDRNLTPHTYHEEIALQIFKKLPRYYQLFNTMLSNIDENI